jgi:esterase/lipase superfamily enzyme
VFRQLLSLVVALIAAASVAAGQSTPDLSQPEPCRAGITQDLPALEKRKAQLERQIPRSFRTKTMRKRQEELLRVVFQIECLKTRDREQVVEILPSQRPSFRSDGRPRNIVEVTTYYATNRNLSGNPEPAKVYGSHVAQLSYGRAIVTIPTTHKEGNIELPSIWRLEREPDPNRHFVLKSVTPLKTDAARAEMTEKLKGPDGKAVLVYLHGYNMGFSEAAMRTAQLAYDLRFPGVPLFFSWPSAGQAVAYLQDAETAQLSEGAFDQLLEDLAELPTTDIYVIAHSMGSRIVSQVLKSRVERGKSTRHLTELLMAAPDINADLFRTVIAPKLATIQEMKTTVYASSSDLALRASKVVHGFKRVGETDGGVLVYQGLETVDATSAAFVTRAFGHSYLTDSATVLKDIQSILRQKLSAKQRGLAEAGKLPDLYWRLP